MTKSSLKDDDQFTRFSGVERSHRKQLFKNEEVNDDAALLDDNMQPKQTPHPYQNEIDQLTFELFKNQI